MDGLSNCDQLFLVFKCESLGERPYVMSGFNLDELLDALQFLSSNGSGYAIEDWKAIAFDALAGSAPAQYLIAAAFERLGDFSQAGYWYARSAAQRFSPAVSRLVALQFATAA
jgi:TPR repeat protein